MSEWSPDIADCSDDQVIEALKAKKPKVITITHGRSS